MNRLPLSSLRAEWTQTAGRDTDDCLMFRCPVCRGKAEHWILVPTRKPSLYPGGLVWRTDGTRELDAVTLFPASIDLTKPIEMPDGSLVDTKCVFHGRVRSGHVEWGD
jgi:hypothetical protein